MRLKGVILAGGKGSRLFPLTKVTNKHLLPVGNAPMIWHPAWKMKQAGIEEILIVTGTEHMGDVVRCLGSGKDFGCRFSYKVQDGGARILLKPMPDLHRFGGAEVKGDQVVDIQEKPKEPKSNLAVAGVYFYNSEVFDILRTIRPSRRGELEISDLNNAYLGRGRMSFSALHGWWSDAGTFPSLTRAGGLANREPIPFPYIPRED